MNWEWTSIDSMSAIPKEVFSTLYDPAQSSSPFLHYSFLNALEKSNSVGGNSGWQPNHLIIRDELSQIIAFIPAYIKSHSYGEYVFDHSWANAYHQHGLPYYPKLLMAIPFTPVPGPRILLARNIKMAKLIDYLGKKNKQIMEQLDVSSVHLLFADSALSDALASDGFHQRQSVQFNWHNNDYRHMDDFMASLTARRRRSIKKERASISKQGVQIKKIAGTNISQSDMHFFYNCYQQTYIKRSGHSGYLTEAFFTQLLQSMPENLLLVMATKEVAEHEQITSLLSESIETKEKVSSAPISPIASALFLYDERGLYGRYWGALADVSNLHFEVCYYQGIEFCIERNIGLFNPGTQGEHKILRGFTPTICYSNHKMNEEAFDLAVKDFLVKETPHIIEYARQSESLLPYKKNNVDQ
jgi:predicted N-acyltransferase